MAHLEYFKLYIFNLHYRETITSLNILFTTSENPYVRLDQERQLETDWPLRSDDWDGLRLRWNDAHEERSKETPRGKVQRRLPVTYLTLPNHSPPNRKIKDNKQHTINEGKKVNDSLKRFQDKFTQQMTELSNLLNQRIAEEKEYMTNECKRGHDRMAMLEDMLR